MDLATVTQRLWDARQQGDFSPAWLNGALTLGTLDDGYN